MSTSESILPIVVHTCSWRSVAVTCWYIHGDNPTGISYHVQGILLHTDRCYGTFLYF